MKSEHAVRNYLVSYAALLLFTSITVGVAFIDFGPFNIFIALTIAVIKAVIVTLIFMHLKDTSYLARIFFAAAVVWVILVITGFLPDYMMRNRPYESSDPSWILKPASHFKTTASEETNPSQLH